MCGASLPRVDAGEERALGLRIAVIHHAADRPGWVGRYLLVDFCRAFEAQGHRVVHLRGTSRFAPADVALLHVDLSVVPDSYVAFGRRWPILLNGRITDIRKRTVSGAVLRPGEAWTGPVIVKTDLNHGGAPERSRQSLARKLARRARAMLRGRGPDPLDYPIFASLDAVPAELRASPDHVVERFVPERDGPRYVLRQTYVLGRRHITWRFSGTTPILRWDGLVREEQVATPAAIVRYCREIGLDYGKVDHVEHAGAPIVLDVSKTIGCPGVAPETLAALLPALAELADPARCGTRPEQPPSRAEGGSNNRPGHFPAKEAS